MEGTPDLAGELALFNKVGDLRLKVSQVPEAVEMYERAVSLYADNGFPNNAIALCNKILRNAPGRTHVYLKLAQLMVERGFVAEAKQNLLEYADRMQKAGKTDDAFRALKEFADLSPDNEEIRLLLAEQLRAASRDGEAREQLEKLYAESQAAGDRRRSRATLDQIKAIDPDFDEETASTTAVKVKKQKSSDLVFLDVEYDTDAAASAEPAPSAAAPAPEPEPVVSAEPEPVEPVEEPEPAAVSEELPLLDGELDIERVSQAVDAGDTEVGTLEGLDVGAQFAAPADEAEAEALDLEPTSLVEPDTVAEPAEPEGVGLEIEKAREPAEAVEAESVEIEEPAVVSEEIDIGGDLPLIEVESDEELTLEPVSGGAVDIDVPDLDLGAGLETEIDLSLGEAEDEPVAPVAEPADEEAPVKPVSAEADEPVEAVDLATRAEEVEEEAAEEPVEEVEEAGPPDIPALEAAVADDPDDPGHHVTLGEALIGTGQRERGIEELGIAVGLYEARQEWSRAAGMTDEIIRLDPSNVAYHQKRVEFAYRIGDRGALTTAYVNLADALFRSGAIERARAVYGRVLEHDPENAHALGALATLQPEEEAVEEAAAAPADQPSADFVDLGALVMEEEPVRDTRMRIQDEEPTGDEERDFAEMLSQFKRGIEQNIGDEDWQAHYDLGVAFKEMGLVDEAIAEFQKSLRSPKGRLQTAEALGNCFYEKGQFSVAATVMRRAVDIDTSGDEAKIGLLYWLGRCEEQQQRIPEALVYYQRVFALDINFQDVSDRVKQLARARK